MALTQILNVSSLCSSATRRFPTRGAGLFALSRLDSNSVNLICVAGKKTVAEELGLPEPPKRPLLAFMRFLNLKLKSDSDVKGRDRISKLSKEWKLLNESQKATFVDECSADMEDYKKKYNEYINHLTPDQLLQIKELKRKRKIEKDVSQQRKKYHRDCKELGKPKYPGNAFTLFMKAVSPSIEQGNLMKSAAEKWKVLSEETKETYRNEAKTKVETYREEFVEWEKKMKKIGRNDLLDKMSLKLEPKTSKKNL